jgi:hypothetical protein
LAWPDENSMGDIMLGIMGINFYAVIIVSIFFIYLKKKEFHGADRQQLSDHRQNQEAIPGEHR